MNTHWDPKAKAALRQVARYINMRFGRKARQDFMQRVKEKEAQLKHAPGIGQIDPLFEDRPQAYRSVIIIRRDSPQGVPAESVLSQW